MRPALIWLRLRALGADAAELTQIMADARPPLSNGRSGDPIWADATLGLRADRDDRRRKR
jgi:hypothetical protein